MTTALFIGDEVSATAFRLAGMAVRVPAEGEEAAALAEVGGEVELVLITAECAARIPPAALRRALTATAPLTLVVPDVRGRQAPPDLAARLRVQLGMEE